MRTWLHAFAVAIAAGSIALGAQAADPLSDAPLPSQLINGPSLPEFDPPPASPVHAAEEKDAFVLPLPSDVIFDDPEPTVDVPPSPPPNVASDSYFSNALGDPCSRGACRRCCGGFELGGWIDQGFSVVANNPADRYNGVVTFNDRDAEYQMNQFWLYAERKLDPCWLGWQLGGRIDFVYGTDARFTQAADGLEANWNQTEPFYQAALPQFYLDVANDGWLVRMGHFYTLLGYEVVQAPENFFYSHAYTMQYGEPFTHFGFLLSRDFWQQWSLTVGLHRGNDQFDDTDGLDATNYLGSLTWTNCKETVSYAFAVSCSEQGPGASQMIYSLVGTWDITDRLRYVAQHDLGDAFDPALGTRAEWYGLNQYLLYRINSCWSAGLRIEWFRDDDGVRVRGLGAGNQNQGQPLPPPHFIGDFYEITAGLNWRPTCNLTVRPEARWDWFHSDLPTPPGTRPYDAGDRSGQFLFACDVVYTF